MKDGIIILGNIVLVTVWHFVGNNKSISYMVSLLIALVLGAVTKFLTLYVGIVKIAVPVLLKLPEKQAVVVSGIFSVPQLFTALIGGILAVIILPVLKKALS